MNYNKLIALAIIAVTLCLVNPAIAGAVKIYPVGSDVRDMSHPIYGRSCIQDVWNIQSAVLENPGGIIVLKAENPETGATEFSSGTIP